MLSKNRHTLPAATNKRPGRLIEHKISGKTGTVYNDEPTVFDKLLVYFTDGTRGLCQPANLKLTGYVD